MEAKTSKPKEEASQESQGHSNRHGQTNFVKDCPEKKGSLPNSVKVRKACMYGC